MPESVQPLAPSLKKITLICSLLAICIGVAGFCGWIFNSFFLKSFLSDGATMKVNTAILIIAAGSALCLLIKNQYVIARTVSCFVIFLSLLLLAEHITGVNLRIDELLFKDVLTNSLNAAPGRTSLLTAFNILMAGLAIFALTNRHFLFAQLLAAVVFIVVYVSLMGHIFNIGGFYQFGKYSGIAFHTALSLLLIGTGILTAEPAKGWIGTVYERLAKKNLQIYFFAYFLGAAPLMASVYLFMIQRSRLSPASDIVVSVAIAVLLSLPLAYFLLRMVGKLGLELNQTDTKLQIALDAASLGTYDLDLLTGNMSCSPQCKANFGLAANDIFSFTDLIAATLPAYREELQAKVNAAIANDTIYHDEYGIRWPDGTVHWITVSGKPIYDSNGKAIAMTGVIFDNSPAKNASDELQNLNEELAAANEELSTINEELSQSRVELQDSLAELSASNVFVKLAVEAANFGTWNIDVKTREFTASPRLKELFGFHHDELVNLADCIAQITDDFRDNVAREIERMITAGGDHDLTYGVKGFHDAQIRWVRSVGNLTVDDAGNFTSFTGVIMDITRQVNAVQAITESEERFRIMSENSGLLIAVSDETSNATFFSKAWSELTGRSIEDLLKFGWVDLVHAEDKERFVNTYLDAFKIQGPFTSEFRVLNSNGNYRWLLARGQPRFHTDGSFLGYISSCVDITNQLAVRQQLKDSEERLQLLADNISQLAWMTDETGYIFWYNKRWYDYTGTTFAEMQGWGWDKVQHPDHLALVVEKWTANIQSGKIFELTFPLRSAAGEFRWFLTRAVPLKDEAGQVIRWFGTNTDINEQRQDEQRKNDFIAMVSHEMKTPLTSLMGYVQLMQFMTKNHANQKLSDILNKSSVQLVKINTMITGFLDMSRFESGKIHLQKQEFILKALIEETIAETKLVNSTCSIVFEPCIELNVNGDRDKIGQVVTNLLSNAIKYSTTDKNITVACKNDKKMAVVSVTDEGMGIDEQDIQKLFDRFYRVESKSRETISGFGIGLYLSAEIIRRHSGKIWVESCLGKGSTFYFSLPL